MSSTPLSIPVRALTALLSTVLAASTVLLGAAPAHAEDGYRYWNYAHLDGEAWAFAETGPGDVTPEEGAVEGWRFGTSTVSQGIYVRADLAEVDFAAVCGDVEAAEGEKRVAVLVDFGTEADSEGAETPEPFAECAVVPADANGAQVLESVVDVRQQDGMICALDGYPAQGCGTPVPDAQVEAEEQPVSFALPAEADDAEPAAADAAGADDGGAPWGLIAVLAVAALLVALAVPMYRRKQTV